MPFLLYKSFFYECTTEGLNEERYFKDKKERDRKSHKERVKIKGESKIVQERASTWTVGFTGPILKIHRMEGKNGPEK